MNRISQGISDVLELFFPSLCTTCGERLATQERYICMNCWNDLPVTNFHKNPDNKVAQLFWGRVEIENATAFFSYKKGSKYQQLIHYTKYKGLKELGFETGRKFGFALSKSERFSSVNVIVPVPLHPKKERKRGYNQSRWIAAGIADVLQKPVSDNNLFRKTDTSTQTRKNRYERWQNVDGIFGINRPDEFSNKHILLIDDVITTGSTLEACACKLLKLKDTKVSIATLGFADL
uniref:ComF family protein n=1 Tax=uncultured Draconibacterium sp. TaxID=1573823 RepID=UPI003216626C